MERTESNPSPGGPIPPNGWPNQTTGYPLFACDDDSATGVLVPFSFEGAIKVLGGVEGLTVGKCYYTGAEAEGTPVEFPKQFFENCTACQATIQHYLLSLCGDYEDPPVPVEFVTPQNLSASVGKIVRLSNGFCYEVTETEVSGNDVVAIVDTYDDCEGCVQTAGCDGCNLESQGSAAVSASGYTHDPSGSYVFDGYDELHDTFSWKKWVDYGGGEGDWWYFERTCAGEMIGARLGPGGGYIEADTWDFYCDEEGHMHGTAKGHDGSGRTWQASL